MSWERKTGAAECRARGRKPGCVRLEGKWGEGQERKPGRTPAERTQRPPPALEGEGGQLE